MISGAILVDESIIPSALSSAPIGSSYISKILSPFLGGVLSKSIGLTWFIGDWDSFFCGVCCFFVYFAQSRTTTQSSCSYVNWARQIAQSSTSSSIAPSLGA